MLHILHAADLHLDAPFAALSPDQARQRRSEQRQLLARLADLAIDRGADLVLLSGDLLDHRQTYRETAQALAAELGRIPAPVAIAPGNHDFYTLSGLYAAPIWPRNVILFRDSRPALVELPFCDLYGAAFTGAYRDDSPLRDFTAPDRGKPAIMVVHGDVNGTGRYGSISPEEIAASGLTYLALGHIHACSGLQKAGSTYWAYPGCPEGRGFDETGDKGALWITVADDGAVEAEFVPLAARNYEILDCDLTGKDPLQALLRTLEGGSVEDIARVVLTGEARRPDLAALGQAAQGKRWALTLRDHTRPPRDLWGRMEEDSLTGLFLRDMRRRMDDAQTDDERATLAQALRFGLAALENGEDLP